MCLGGFSHYTMLIKDLIKHTVDTIPTHNSYTDSLCSYSEYIFNFRFVGLKLPRRSGKTETLLALHREISSMLLVPNMLLHPGGSHRGIFTFSEIENINCRIRGRGFNGLKYQAILVDEYQVMKSSQLDDLRNLLYTMKAADILTTDFYILGLGT